jgi:hypothetical protein
MYTKLIVPVILFLISSSSGCNSFKSTDLRKTPQDVARLITADLLSRPDFMMYQTPDTANHVDVNVYGILPLEIFIQTRNQKYLTQGPGFADGQWENPLPDGLTSQIRYWIDDIYMIGCLQVQAYRATGNMIYLERAASEIDSYIQKLQQPNGLFYHGIDAPFFWGRGNGWVAAGFAELPSVLPEKILTIIQS